MVPDELSHEAQVVLCAMIHLPLDQHEEVFAPKGVWDELSEAFPIELLSQPGAVDLPEV